MIKTTFFAAENDNRKFNSVEFDANTSTQKFSSNTFYLFFGEELSGYTGPNYDKVFNATGNYGNSSLQDYADVWNYDTEFSVIDMIKGSKLALVSPDTPSVVKALTLNNGSVNIDSKDNSSIIVFGGSYNFNNGNTINLYCFTHSTNSGTQTISTESICHIIYVEPK